MIKIHDKPVSQIFRELPFAYKVLVVVGMLFITFTVLHTARMMLFGSGLKSEDEMAAPLVLTAPPMTGKLDPSIAVNPQKGHAIMLFTGLGVKNMSANKFTEYSISLAQSTLPCPRWFWALHLFSSRQESLIAPDGQSELAFGKVIYETPSIVYDPQDKGREWKAYAFRYFWVDDKHVAFAQRYSAIVMRYATDPVGEWSPEEWTLAAAPDYPPMPYQRFVRQQIKPMSPALANFKSYARPSVLATQDGVLLMTLSAFGNSATPDAVILMISTDHGRSWNYAGTPLTTADAAKLGPYTHIGGATLVQEDGIIYLAAVLGDAKTKGLGTFTLPFGDIGKGELQRDKEGRPLLVKHIPLQNNQLNPPANPEAPMPPPNAVGGGFATYSQGCSLGVISSEYTGRGGKGSFSLIRTIESPTGKTN